MTLLFFDGLDNARVQAKPEWDSNPWNQPVSGRDGLTNGAATTAPSQQKVLTLAGVGANTLLCGFAFKLNTTSMFGAVNSGVISCAKADGTRIFTVTFDGSGHFLLRSGDQGSTVRATGTYSNPQNIWTHLQVRIVPGTTAGVAQLYVNGSLTADINYTGIGGAIGPVTQVIFGNGTSSVSDAVSFDDIWVADEVDATATQGRPNNTLLGDLKVVTLLPTAAGDVTGWTPSTGANWAAVDETPVNTSDFVSTSIAGTQDLYTMSDIPANTVTVFGVRPGHYAQKADAGAAFIKPLLKQGNGTLSTQAVQPLTYGSWVGVWGVPTFTKADGSVWSPPDINALQAGYEAA